MKHPSVYLDLDRPGSETSGLLSEGSPALLSLRYSGLEDHPKTGAHQDEEETGFIRFGSGFPKDPEEARMGLEREHVRVVAMKNGEFLREDFGFGNEVGKRNTPLLSSSG